jgi:hypothetical protein
MLLSELTCWNMSEHGGFWKSERYLQFSDTMLWPDENRTRYAAVCERMADGSEGRRMRRTKGARHAHAAMRAQGRTPGDEGRAVIAWNREARRRDTEQGNGWRHGQTNLTGI